MLNTHVVFASLFFVLMLIAQALYTYEDNQLRHIDKPAPLYVRIAAIVWVLGLILYAVLKFLFTFEPPGSGLEWQGTFAIILWYSSFLMEKDEVFTRQFTRKDR